MRAGASRSLGTSMTGFSESHPFLTARSRSFRSRWRALFTRTLDIVSPLRPGNAFMWATNCSMSSMVNSAIRRSTPKKGMRCVSRRLFRSRKCAFEAKTFRRSRNSRANTPNAGGPTGAGGGGGGAKIVRAFLLRGNHF